MVLRGLSPAVRFAGRLPGATAAPARAEHHRQATGGTVSTAAGCPLGERSVGTDPATAAAALRAACGASAGARWYASNRTVGDRQRREGVPQGERQPGLPLRAARPAGRGCAGVLVRLARQPARGGRGRVLQHVAAVRRVRPRRPGRERPTCLRSVSRSTTSTPTYLDDRQPSQFTANVPMWRSPADRRTLDTCR